MCRSVLSGPYRQAMLLSLSVLLLAGLCAGQRAITTAPKAGPPTSKVLVSGSGFTPSGTVNISFDTVSLASVVADSSGKFANAQIQVPSSATPGSHSVTAVDQSTSASAQATFLVQTTWEQYR